MPISNAMLCYAATFRSSRNREIFTPYDTFAEFVMTVKGANLPSPVNQGRNRLLVPGYLG